MPDRKQSATAIAVALALATKTAQTAEALAQAKVTSDATAAVLATDISYIKLDIGEIKSVLKDLTTRDTLYVLKEDFFFWRNILVSGVLMTIFISVILKYINQ